MALHSEGAMNSQIEVYESFDQKISKLAIVNDGEEWGLTGKFCRVTAEGDNWDVWLCNPKDLTKGLGTGKRNNIVAAMGGDWHLLDGEAWIVAPKEQILANLKTLGIRAKRFISDEQKEASKKRLAEYQFKSGSNVQSDA